MSDKEKILKLKDKADKLAQEGKWQKSLELYQECASLDPKNDRVMRRIGEIYQKLGDKQNASQSYKKVANLYARNGFWAKAISVNKQILDMSPNDSEVQKSLQELYGLMGIKSATKTVAVPKAVPTAVPITQVASGLELASGVHDRHKSLATTDNMEQFFPCIDLHDTHELRADGQVKVKADYGAAQAVAAAQSAAAPPAKKMTNHDWLTTVIELDDDVVELDEVVKPPTANPVPLFSGFSPAEMNDIMQRLTVQQIAKDSVICTQGEQGNSMFIIAGGSAQVSVETEAGEKLQVAHLKSGDFFGEFGLLSDGKRHATVLAKTAMEVMEITKQGFKQIADKHPRVIQVLDQYYRERFIDTVVRQNVLFKDLTREERQKYVARFQVMKLPANTYLFKEGDQPGDVYFIKSGIFQVLIQRDGDTIALAQLGPGDFFGEIALITGKTRTAAVRSVGSGEVLYLNKDDAAQVLKATPVTREKLKQIVQARAEDAAATYQTHKELKLAMV